MILLFLGSWRSTLIIAISIPLSILTSIIVLSALGETINIMTLGGLALAVGILVDDATVDNRKHRAQSRTGQGDASRRFSTAPRRSPCRRWFRHCASASCFCRCFFSPAWRDTCSCRWRKRWCSPCWRPMCFRERWCRRWRSICCKADSSIAHRPAAGIPLARFSAASSDGFERLRAGYHRHAGRPASAVGAIRGLLPGCSCCSLALSAVPWLGQDFFPSVGQRASSSCTCAPRPGTRIEETARALRSGRERSIRAHDSARRDDQHLDNIGLPYSRINMSYSNSAPIGTGGRRHHGRAHAESIGPPRSTCAQLRAESAAGVSRQRASTFCRPTSSARF